MWIDLLRDYRGIKINDELWLKGVYEVEDDLGNYLISKGYAQATNEPLPAESEEAAPDEIAFHNQLAKVQPITQGNIEFVSPPTTELEADEPDEPFGVEANLSRDVLLEMAEEYGIEVEGTGKDGYITKQDLIAALDNRD